MKQVNEVIAHGGISALGGLLPVFIVIWSIGLGLFIWFIFSAYVLFSTSATQKVVKAYQIFSVFLVSVILLAAIFGSAFLSILVLLAAFLISIVVGGITAFILSYVKKRGADT